MYPQWFYGRLRALDEFIQQHGGYAACYCGIAADPEERLFDDHEVLDGWIHTDFGSDHFARVAERHFHNRGCKGSHGGGSSETRFVYVYRITDDTIE
jgi:hypothetical protein